MFLGVGLPATLLSMESQEMLFAIVRQHLQGFWPALLLAAGNKHAGWPGGAFT